MNGLQEDNDRINRMYQIVEREASFGDREQENRVPSNHHHSHRVEESRDTMKPSGSTPAGGKWKQIDDDNYSTGQFLPPYQPLSYPQGETVKRNGL